MKKIIYIVISLLVIGAIGFTLKANKEEMKQEAKLAEVESEAIPVKVSKVIQKRKKVHFDASGTFEAQSDITILSETQGEIVNVFKSKGNYVQKGEIIAKIDEGSLRANLKAAEAQLEKLKRDKERFSKLVETQAVTERELEDVTVGLENAKASVEQIKTQLENTTVRATNSGIINQEFVDQGDYVTPGLKLFEVVDTDELKLIVKLSASDVLYVKTSDTINIDVDVFPGKTFTGTVHSVSEKANSSLQYEVDIRLENNQAERIKAGMYATAYFEYPLKDKGLFIPRSAVAGSIQDPEVFIYNQDKAQLKSVVLGRTFDDELQIIDGLEENEDVIVSGQINLTDGIDVKILEE